GLALAVVIALQDQVRWQPWFYLYLLGLVPFLVPGADAERPRQEGVLATLRFLLAAMYFWSGFHKLGPGFARVHERAFENPLRESWGETAAEVLGSVQPAVPWIEMLTAVLLLVPIGRTVGAILAVGTHLWVLLLIGPAGTRSNEVVWPWNLAMAALVLVLFWRAPAFGWRAMFAAGSRFAAVPVVVLAGIMPAFSPEHWDRYLSFHLYSGQNQRLMLVLDQDAVVALPPRYRAYLVPSKVDDRLLELRLKDWTYKELRVPFPGEERMNLKIGRDLAALPFPAGANVFFYFDYEFQMQERGWDRFTPAEMREMKRFPAPRQKLREAQ
ncbi:MAG: hypothetical protein HKN82_12930, partial [Akkermansiaceae bacterium]|nr:hypothetical protein [Akkermansiaceae bacterium]